ncbi:MAG: hypothetical protein ACJ8E1_15490, partial [Xanthobacteraceae bacterium]
DGGHGAYPPNQILIPLHSAPLPTLRIAIMKRRKPAAKRKPPEPDAPLVPVPDVSLAPSSADDQVTVSNFSLHDLFQQQTREMLDRTDLDEEQKQSILVAMSCPCCGAGGMSFTAKLKRRT